MERIFGQFPFIFCGNNQQAKIRQKATKKKKLTQSITNLGETSEINIVIESYANLNINGSGGADAVVAYAKILARIDLIDMTAPMKFYAESNRTAGVNSVMTLSGLNGEIGFKAGICIPIPFLSFRLTHINTPIVCTKRINRKSLFAENISDGSIAECETCCNWFLDFFISE